MYCILCCLVLFSVLLMSIHVYLLFSYSFKSIPVINVTCVPTFPISHHLCFFVLIGGESLVDISYLWWCTVFVSVVVAMVGEIYQFFYCLYCFQLIILYYFIVFHAHKPSSSSSSSPSSFYSIIRHHRHLPTSSSVILNHHHRGNFCLRFNPEKDSVKSFCGIDIPTIFILKDFDLAVWFVEKLVRLYEFIFMFIFIFVGTQVFKLSGPN